MNILVGDIGNTRAHFAQYTQGQFRHRLRVPTPQVTSKVLSALRHRFPLPEIEAMVIASVVPDLTRFLKRRVPSSLGLPLYRVGENLAIPLKNRYRKPSQVGADRLMNALAAHHEHPRRDLVIVDFGTAITFDVVSKKGEYLGGVIAPGIEISLEALFQQTARLPRVRLQHPTHLMGSTTVESIRIGCSVGIGGLCDRIVDKIRSQTHRNYLVIGTGGYAAFMRRYCRCIQRIDTDLVLKGITLTWRCGSTKKLLTKKRRFIQ